ncbi:MAG: DegT/DnrJ/EryC1/StrS family aminotransferase [Calditrichaceae bacterium]
MNLKKIWLSSPHMSGEELKYIQEAFDTNWIAPLGPHVDAFENEVANFVGVKHAAALMSGTAAIHLALVMLGVGSGDEVICQSFTFSASANPIIYQHATPVFVDSETDTWNMDPNLLEEAIKDRILKGRKPKAVILVHLYGQPAKLDEIIQICNRYEIPLIEDAAEALGSEYKAKKAGSFGKFGILSFNGNKIITTSGGGMLISNDEDIIQKARFLSTQARDDAPHYEHTHIGYNYRMSNVLAAIGRGQMSVLRKRIEQRRSVFEHYKTVLSDLPGIHFQPEYKGTLSNRWLTALTIDPKLSKVDREKVRLELAQKNIESRPLWKPMHLQPVFKNAPAYINGNSELLFLSGLCLPSGSNLEKNDLIMIADTVKNIIIS